ASDTDPLGLPAEGQEFLGSINLTTDASGTASVDTILAVAVANGRIITATATDAIGNTSEFSAGLAVPTTVPTTVPAAPPTGAADGADGAANGPASESVPAGTARLPPLHRPGRSWDACPGIRCPNAV